MYRAEGVLQLNDARLYRKNGGFFTCSNELWHSEVRDCVSSRVVGACNLAEMAIQLVLITSVLC
jgi:hypothetical protein